MRTKVLRPAWGNTITTQFAFGQIETCNLDQRGKGDEVSDFSH